MSIERPLKRRLSYCNSRDGSGSGFDHDSGRTYKFKILLPNGWTTHLTLRDPPEQRMQVSEFVGLVRKEVERDSHGLASASRSGTKMRAVKWNPQMYLEDVFGKKISSAVVFPRFAPNKCHLLILHEDIEDSVEKYKNMWDLTPYTDVLEELPAEYTFEAALADLIDDSLQAVWWNAHDEKRFIGVIIEKDKIDIFDSGPGMDGTDDNSIAKWGKMGSSNHKADKEISGEPPYLQPFFGMFGYGGPIAAMHLGRKATVSSKTKQCRKVYTLHLSRDRLLESSSSGCAWKVDGGIRNTLEDEKELCSSHGSFTWVEISNLKMKCPYKMHMLRCLLKDIYFPYIQHDEAGNSNKTVMPVEFLVNGVNLAEVSGGEMATANWHSCNEPDFVLQLNFTLDVGESVMRVANARLKFVYFPIVKGQETIEIMLKKLKKDGYNRKERFENFSRVSIRRLGRLLPEARWEQLPLMDFIHSAGNEAPNLKSCSRRVKCFVDTDDGFSPTLSKTDLQHQDAFTLALKNFGSKSISNGKESQDVSIEIFRNGERLSISQLKKDYIEWVREMHERYDEEVECCDDEPTVILKPPCKRKLGITQDVIRVHKAIKRMGKSWKTGQKVKVLKEAIGTLKENMYATLECIIVEGLAGDGGEARLICRPIEVPDDRGCKIAGADGENPTIAIQESVSFPISLIDTRKIVAIDQAEFKSQLKKCMVELPSIPIPRNEQHKEVGNNSVHDTQVPRIESERPNTPHGLKENCHLACSPMSCQTTEFLQAYLTDTQRFEEEIEKIGTMIGCLETSISELLDRKTALEKEISILKAKLGEPYHRHLSSLEDTKEAMKQQIEQLCPGTMASVLVQLSRRKLPNFDKKKELKVDCDSLVALLATTSDPRLSRILAKYLGEDRMLSIVSNTEGSSSIVQYDTSGTINKNYGIYKVASNLGINIDKPISVIDVDKMMPYVGDFYNGDAQKKLAIPDPHSPLHQNGPTGFVGYAVNLLNFTNKKVDLRTTLFYPLFGQLQVYQTRHDMELAHDYIKDGAVSLDGAIMRRNRVLPHRDTQEPKITFPVLAPLQLKEINMDVLAQVQKKNSLLDEAKGAHYRLLQMHQDVLRQYKSKRDHFNNSLQKMKEYISSNNTGQSVSLTSPN